MSYTLHTSLPAKKISYGASRSASQIKYLVYHYTGNKTDSAKGNANYFHTSNTRYAGAHYFVDDTTVYQSISDLKVAYAVGGGRQSSSGGSMYGKITNTNSISIEMCSKNGIITASTIANAVSLGKKLMKKYNIPIGNVYRHWDVNGKSCPGWSGWTGNDASKWKSLKSKLTSTTNNNTSSNSFKVKVTADTLNVRSGAGTSYKIKSVAHKGDVFTIVKETDSWYKLKDNAGWIAKKHTKPYTNSFIVRVTSKTLNVRSGAGTSYKIVKTVKKGDAFTITDESNGWYKLKSGDGWISKKYCEKV